MKSTKESKSIVVPRTIPAAVPSRLTAPAPNGKGREKIEGLARGLAVIRAFSAAGPSCTLTEVAKVTGLSPAAVRRCLHTLEELGYAGRNGRQFFLRPRVLDLGAAYLDSVNSETLANDYLQDVVVASGHSSSLTTLDDTEIVYLAHAGAKRLLRIEAGVGTRYPAYATSMGRVMLSALSDTDLRVTLIASEPKKLCRHTVDDVNELMDLIKTAREQEYSIVEDQLAVGILSVAVPVKDKSGRIVASINCSAQTGESTQRGLKAFLPILRKTATRITQAIRYFPALTNIATGRAPQH